MARIPIIVGNWKLHKTIGEAVAFATELKNKLGTLRDVEVGVAPVFPALSAVAKRLEGTPAFVCAQDCYFQDTGAFTGEVSAPLLKDAGATHVIVGHSERRQYFGDTDELVGKKAAAALRSGLSPIVCVGESEKERDQGTTFARVTQQLDGALAGVSDEKARTVVIAYEPVWAIGTGKTATPAQAEDVHAFIRQKLTDRFGRAADDMRIQYGGSVKPDNAAELLRQPNIDGALVGGASLDVESFVRLLRASR